MTQREYADSDTPYAGRYIEYITEEDVCVCGHANEFHNDKCSKCKCTEFELDEDYGEPDWDLKAKEEEL